MEGKLFPGFFRNIFRKRFGSESFIILDIGTFSVKALYIERKKSEVSTIAFSNKQHVGGDISADGSFNVSGITTTCRAALGEVRVKAAKGKNFTNRVFLGIGGGFVYGKTLTQTYIREHPQKEIDYGELNNIIQKVQQRNYEQIRKYFKKETGRSELEVYLINGFLQDIKIDGYQVVNPIGFKGKEISCSLFNSYIPKVYLGIFQDIIKTLGLELVSIFSEPHSVFESVSSRNKEETDFILIDIGGSVTEISIARKGRLDDIRSISMGGSSFTKSISDNLKVGFWEAENIKRRFIKGNVSGSVSKKIESILKGDIELFIRGLEIALSDLSQVTLLPSKVYMYGGGALLPPIEKLLKKYNWRDTLSFFAKPEIVKLSPPRLGSTRLRSPYTFWTVSFSMADTYLAERMQKDETAKAIKRSLRLIQN